MADTAAFEALAAKLPPDQQAQFLAMSVQLRNLPPDDELVLAIEALGFTALILKEIPEEISDVIGKMRSGLSDAQRDGLREDIEQILVNSLDTPSYADLRETILQMKEHHNRVRREIDGILNALSRTRQWLERRNAILPSTALGLCAGLVCGAMTIGFHLLARLDGNPSESAVPLPVAQGIVDYHEAEMPDLGGKVGMVVVGGEVLGAFKEGNRGVVVVKPLSEP